MGIGCSHILEHTGLWLVGSLPLDLNLPIPENVVVTAWHTQSLAASALAPASFGKGTGPVFPLPSILSFNLSEGICARVLERAYTHTHTPD